MDCRIEEQAALVGVFWPAGKHAAGPSTLHNVERAFRTTFLRYSAPCTHSGTRRTEFIAVGRSARTFDVA